MNILIVEDSEPEKIIIKEAFKEANVNCNLCMAKDGVEALEFLNQEGEFERAPKPNLIILDLNLPRKNGLEVLAEVKNNPKWRHIPILIFSNSEFPMDICQCYELNANAYINKPSEFQEFIDLANMINVFWLKAACYYSH